MGIRNEPQRHGGHREEKIFIKFFSVISVTPWFYYSFTPLCLKVFVDFCCFGVFYNVVGNGFECTGGAAWSQDRVQV